jgi:hypothetical protein
MAKQQRQRKASRSEVTLENALNRQEQRTYSEMVIGDVVPDRNFQGRVLVVLDSDTFYSVDHNDILEQEQVSEFAYRLWIRPGSQIWRCVRSWAAGEALTTPFAMEKVAPPAVRLLPGDPQPGTVTDQQNLMAGATIEGTAKVFSNSCEGRDREENNCAHFLSDAFIRAGFSDLRNAHSCIQARCGTSSKRPVRARDMWCWFKTKASETGGEVARNTGLWAVFQLKENVYWGGHVAIIDSNTWKYYGTGWYSQWDQYAYKW